MTKKDFLIALAAIFSFVALATAQITVPYTFTPGSTISSTQVNSNFSTIAANALNRTGGTMTGLLTTIGVQPSADNVSDLGSASFRYANLWTKGTTQFNTQTYTWPSSAGSAGQALTTNGSGTLSWAAGGCGTVTGQTANYNAVLCDIVEITSNTITITLPAASGCAGTANRVGVKNDVAVVQTIARTGSDTIDGVAGSFSTYGVQYESFDFVCNAAKTGWMVR